MLDTVSITLPSGKTAKVREMTGKDESLLQNKRLMKTGEAIDKILVNCTEELDGSPPSEEDILNLEAIDRKALLVAIRKLSYGSIVDFTVVCPVCSARNLIKFNLDEDIRITPPQEGDTVEVILPKTGFVVKLEKFTGKHEARMVKMRNDELYGTPVYLTIVEIDGKPKNKKIFAELPASDLRFLRQKVREFNGVFDTSGEETCFECGGTLKFDALATTNFFFPDIDNQ